MTLRMAFAAGAAALALALSSSADAAPPPAPGAAWQKVSPASVGLDPAKLSQIAAQAGRGRSNCLVVVRDGKLAGEWYFRGTGPSTTQDVFSVTKSVASTLVGMAQDEGRLRIGQSASRWISQWRGTPSAAVTVRDLLSMDSGREWSALTDYVGLLAARDRTAFAIGLGQAAAPGTVWAYNNSAVQTLDRVLFAATHESVVRFAQQRLFRPLGMAHTTMTTDRAGNAQMFEGVRSKLSRPGALRRAHARPRPLAREADRLAGLGRAGHGDVLDEAERRVRLPLVAQPRRRGCGRALGDQPAAGQACDSRAGLVPGAPDRNVLGARARRSDHPGRPGTRTVVVRLGAADPIPVPPAFGPAQASRVVTEAVIRG